MSKLVSSKGKSKSYIDFIDNLLIPLNSIVPPIEVVSKVVKSNHIKDFSDENKIKLEEKYGYYSDLQSINSEDAITWSYFGYISKFNDDIRLDFFNEFLSLIGCEKDSYCEIKLWQRLPHPETFVSGGPEVDVILIGKKKFIIIECKFNSSIGKNQGVSKNLDQMEIRNKWIDEIGKKLYPQHSINLVFVGKEKKANYQSITWTDLANFENIPHQNEFKKYLASKQ